MYMPVLAGAVFEAACPRLAASRRGAVNACALRQPADGRAPGRRDQQASQIGQAAGLRLWTGSRIASAAITKKIAAKDHTANINISFDAASIGHTTSSHEVGIEADAGAAGATSLARRELAADRPAAILQESLCTCAIGEAACPSSGRYVAGRRGGATDGAGAVEHLPCTGAVDGRKLHTDAVLRNRWALSRRGNRLRFWSLRSRGVLLFQRRLCATSGHRLHRCRAGVLRRRHRL